MDISPEDFRRHYDQLSDAALREIKPEDLTDVARAVFEEEMAKRGLAVGGEAAAEEAPAHESAAEEEELAVAAEFDDPNEAEEAVELLAESKIAGEVAELDGLFKVMVPAEMERAALLILAPPLSDEELAAQAEAAATGDEEP